MLNDNTASSNASPPLVDLTIDNITRNTKLANSQTPNPRLKFLMEKLIDHIHDYARETQLTTEEWMVGLQFLTQCGQMCSNVRQEFILLSDVLGLSVLVDSLDHPKPSSGTESSILGPFYTDDAHDVDNGGSIASPGKGEMCLVLATVKDTDQKPIEGAKIDVWETDDTGHYDAQYDGREGPDLRGRLTSNKNGEFSFKCVRPVSYPIPNDGPVGKLLKQLKRNPYRPAHIHFRINVPEGKYDELVTALFIRGDPYETIDPVFGVKSSLIVDIGRVQNTSIAEKYGIHEQDWLIRWDFVMVTLDEMQALQKKHKRN